MHCICPLTLEPIIVAGATCWGNIYEFDAISKWFQKHTTDPITNRPCPNLFIRRVDIRSETFNIETFRKNSEEMVYLYCPGIDLFLHVETQYNTFLKFVDENQHTAEWKEHFSEGRKKFANNEEKLVWIQPEEEEEEESIEYMDNVDASNLTMKGIDYKNIKFRGTNLSGCIFFNCKFSHCQFLGVDLSNTKFIGCSFKGENFCFYRCICKNVTFINCVTESWSWRTISDGKEFSEMLPQRLLKEHTIKCVGNTVMVM